MQVSNVKSVIIGVGTAAAVIAITGAASGTGVGGIFNLGKTNKVNAATSLTGSAKHSMLSVTNKGAGTALSLQVGKGKAPFSVNSPGRVANLNASLLSGLAASQFVQGGGQSRSFGFFMSTATVATQKLLSVPGFGTLNAICGGGSPGFAKVTFKPTRALDGFVAAIAGSSAFSVNNTQIIPRPDPFGLASVPTGDVSSVWERVILRYATGSGGSLTAHIATLDFMVEVEAPTCDFDASVVTGPGVKAP
jgi:hypothetical protein